MQLLMRIARVTVSSHFFHTSVFVSTQVAAVKNPLLQKAAQRLLTAPKFAGLRKLMTKFRADNPWLEDSALFDALRQQPDLAGLDWWEWPEPLRFRKASAIQEAHKQNKQQVDEFVAVQFLFDRQWRALKVGGAGMKWGVVGCGVVWWVYSWVYSCIRVAHVTVAQVSFVAAYQPWLLLFVVQQLSTPATICKP